MPDSTKKSKILILGGGFGGIKTALELSASPAFDVTLISDEENFRYYPTLYLAAVGGNQVASSISLSEIFKDKEVRVVKDSVKSLDRKGKIVKGASDKKYPYDALIVALGVVT